MGFNHQWWLNGWFKRGHKVKAWLQTGHPHRLHHAAGHGL